MRCPAPEEDAGYLSGIKKCFYPDESCIECAETDRPSRKRLKASRIAMNIKKATA
jgi:hypothetical protein